MLDLCWETAQKGTLLLERVQFGDEVLRTIIFEYYCQFLILNYCSLFELVHVKIEFIGKSLVKEMTNTIELLTEVRFLCLFVIIENVYIVFFYFYYNLICFSWYFKEAIFIVIILIVKIVKPMNNIWLVANIVVSMDKVLWKTIGPFQHLMKGVFAWCGFLLLFFCCFNILCNAQQWSTNFGP